MRVLVAEDDRTTSLLVCKSLEKWGYEVLAVRDGEEAWQVLENETVQMVVIDRLMPGLDGIELTRRLRERPKRGYVFVVMLTSCTERAEIQEGFEAGVDDYLTKPLDAFLLYSRIKAGERVLVYEQALAEKNADLQRYNEQMEAMVAERTQQLMHAERMATLGVLTAGVAHEINNPLTFISGNAQSLERIWRDVAAVLRNEADEAKTAKVKAAASDHVPEIIEGIRHGVGRIGGIVKNLKGFSQPQDQALRRCDLAVCVERALQLTHSTWKKHVEVEKDYREGQIWVLGDEGKIEQVLVNLIINAVQALEKQEGGRLRIGIREDEKVLLAVEDNGPGIPAEQREKIFQPFYTTKEVGQGTGLGLYVVYGIMEGHRGSIRVEEGEDGGACFRLEFMLPTEVQDECEVVNCG